LICIFYDRAVLKDSLSFLQTLQDKVSDNKTSFVELIGYLKVHQNDIL